LIFAKQSSLYNSLMTQLLPVLSDY